jgi:hypothetical protein
MLYEFKSKATGSVVMTGPVAERLLSIVGKSPGPQGIITVEQMGPAIAALQAAIAQESAEPPRQPGDTGRSEPAADETPDARHSISLAQRAWPLLEMLGQAKAAGKDITWGV